MAKVYRRENLGLRNVPGKLVIIPQDPRAKLMFYFNCICTVLDVSTESENVERLRDYSHYYVLRDEEVDILIKLCMKWEPGLFDGVCIFHKPEMCGDLPNKFFELESVRDQMVITNEILVGGRQRRVMKVMFYTGLWILNFHLLPMTVLLPIYKRRLEKMALTLAQASRGVDMTPAHLTLPSYSMAGNLGAANRGINSPTNSSECCNIL